MLIVVVGDDVDNVVDLLLYLVTALSTLHTQTLQQVETGDPHISSHHAAHELGDVGDDAGLLDDLHHLLVAGLLQQVGQQIEADLDDLLSLNILVFLCCWSNDAELRHERQH